MNPSIISGEFGPTEWRGDPSEPILTRYYGGEPIDQPDPPDPPDPPNPPQGNLRYVGDVEVIDEAGTSYGLVNITPKPPSG